MPEKTIPFREGLYVTHVRSIINLLEIFLNREADDQDFRYLLRVFNSSECGDCKTVIEAFEEEFGFVGSKLLYEWRVGHPSKLPSKEVQKLYVEFLCGSMKSELDKHLNTVLHKRIDETACYNLSAKPSMVMVTATIRTRNILDRYYFETVRDLVLKTEKELLSLEQFGPVAIKEVKAWLKQAYDGKLWLGMTEEDLEEFQ